MWMNTSRSAIVVFLINTSGALECVICLCEVMSVYVLAFIGARLRESCLHIKNAHIGKI